MSAVPFQWAVLEAEVNGRGFVGMPGVRDPEYPCEGFTGTGYDGTGTCLSDGHYMCVECHELSPNAPRFENDGGRFDRLRLYWHRPGGPIEKLRGGEAKP